MSAEVVPLNTNRCARCRARAEDFCAQCGAALCGECASAEVWCSRCEEDITAEGHAWDAALLKTWRLDTDDEAPCSHCEAPATRALPCCLITVCDDCYTPACEDCKQSRAHLASLMPLDRAPVPLHDPPGPILHDFARYLKRGGHKRNVVREYVAAVQLLASGWDGALDRLTATLVRRHLAKLHDTDTPTAHNRRLYALRCFYRHCLSLRVIDEDPSIDIPMLVEVPRERDLVEPDSDDNIITNYRRYLEVERAASPHTVRAFVRSVEILVGSPECAAAGSLDLMTSTHVRTYLAKFHGVHRPATRAASLWRLRAFYKYRLRVGAIDRDPTHGLQAPKQDHPLPRPLTEAEVMALINAHR